MTEFRRVLFRSFTPIAIDCDGSKLTQPLSSKKEAKPTNPHKENIFTKQVPLGPEFEKVLYDNLDNLYIRDKEFKTHSPQITNGSSPKQLTKSSRRPLPNRRKGYTQKVYIDGQSVYLKTGEYEDGKLGEIWSEISKEGSTTRALLGGFCKLVSISLQFGVPLEQLVKSFVYTKFEPAGLVQDHDRIKMTTSIFDFIFRDLAIHYLGQEEFANVTQDEDPEPQIFLDLDSLKSPLPLHSKTLEEELVAYSPPTHVAQRTSQIIPTHNSGNICPNCGHNTLITTGTCTTCTTCGSNTGCG